MSSDDIKDINVIVLGDTGIIKIHVVNKRLRINNKLLTITRTQVCL